MKKIMLLAVSLFILMCSGVSAQGMTASGKKSDGLTIKVNGVEVKSAANHLTTDGKAYVSVRAYAQLFDLTYTLSKWNKEVVFNGKKISKIRMKQNEPTAWIKDLANAVHAQQVSWDGKQEVYVLALPEGTIKISESVPAMGEHWSNPQAGDLPNGPIFGVHDGKLVFLEYMIAQDDFIKGVNHTNLDGMKGVPSPAVVQVDIEFQQHGHEGFEVPHYDIHAYFITDEEQQKIK
ncbi:hypothetical protein FHS15_004398 [Paenibacillus castaneae]|uniref:hypothetical protein n=1 Tax=Paenibacillus castaneae TaxID=474957 RepID=UPI001ABA9F91|nr:hypothetical protein [Paenibacillus castaneae]NIK79240.1 hypothetical protein [Paenibacillus castaneae]